MYAMMVISTLLCFFSNSWLVVWALLEINTMAFCMISKFEEKSESALMKENMMKYFVIQSVASAIFILALSLSSSSHSKEGTLQTAVFICLMLKMAAAPLHSWFIKMTKTNPWTNSFILFTWQKLAPLYLISLQRKSWAFLFILLSMVKGALFLINKKSVKEILALSSVFNLSWLISATLISTKNLLTFALIYWASLILFLANFTLKTKTLLTDTNNDSHGKSTLYMSTSNLAGVPPLMMFTAKWYTFSNLLKIQLKMLSLLVLLASSINMFVYLRMINGQNLLSTAKAQKKKSFPSGLFLTMMVSINIIFLSATVW